MFTNFVALGKLCVLWGPYVFSCEMGTSLDGY